MHAHIWGGEAVSTEAIRMTHACGRDALMWAGHVAISDHRHMYGAVMYHVWASSDDWPQAHVCSRAVCGAGSPTSPKVTVGMGTPEPLPLVTKVLN